MCADSMDRKQAAYQNSYWPSSPRVMDSQINHSNVPQSSSATPVSSSCRKKKSEEAAFLADVRDHVDEFIHASMDEHKTCFKNTIQKMFGMSKIIADRVAVKDGVESSLPLQSTVAGVSD